MKRRLVFTGFPCSPEVWQKFLPKVPEQRIVTFHEMLTSVGPDFRGFGKYALTQIREYRPTSIVAHDWGAMAALLALLYAQKHRVQLGAKLTLFNGAFRGFDVLQAPHPIRLQFASWKRFTRELAESGGEADPRLKKEFGRVRALYRRLILISLAQKAQALVGKEKKLELRLGMPVQLIASPNDKYVPFAAIEKMRDDFGIQKVHLVEYGHFPYSANVETSRELLTDFEG